MDPLPGHDLKPQRLNSAARDEDTPGSAPSKTEALIPDSSPDPGLKPWSRNQALIRDSSPLDSSPRPRLKPSSWTHALIQVSSCRGTEFCFNRLRGKGTGSGLPVGGLMLPSCAMEKIILSICELGLTSALCSSTFVVVVTWNMADPQILTCYCWKGQRLSHLGSLCIKIRREGVFMCNFTIISVAHEGTMSTALTSFKIKVWAQDIL